MPIAAILPLIPGIIQLLTAVVEAVGASNETPEELKAKLNTLKLQLKETMAAVEAYTPHDV